MSELKIIFQPASIFKATDQCLQTGSAYGFTAPTAVRADESHVSTDSPVSQIISFS